MASILEASNQNFEGPAYDRDLLWGVINEIQDREFGPDRRRLSKIFEMAKAHEEADGFTKMVMTQTHLDSIN